MVPTTRHVLLLGAGMVSDPLAKYFAGLPHIALTIADSSRNVQRHSTLGDNIETVIVDVHKETERVNELIS
jgi:saccharopine dehydrogenase-like NADP-dependent oxidoreductase